MALPQHQRPEPSQLHETSANNTSWCNGESNKFSSQVIGSVLLSFGFDGACMSLATLQLGGDKFGSFWSFIHMRVLLVRAVECQVLAVFQKHHPFVPGKWFQVESLNLCTVLHTARVPQAVVYSSNDLLLTQCFLLLYCYCDPCCLCANSFGCIFISLCLYWTQGLCCTIYIVHIFIANG